MTDITYQVLVDWEGDDDFTGTDEDITSDVLRMEWSRGRDFGTQKLYRATPGRATITVINENAKYDPISESTDAIGINNLVPYRKVQIKAGRVTASNIVWQGFLESVVTSADARTPGGNIATIHCIGPLGAYRERLVNLAMSTSVNTETAFDAILDDAGVPAGERTSESGVVTLNRFWIDKQQFINALHIIEDAEGGYIGESRDGNIVFENRHHRMSDIDHYFPQENFGDDPAGSYLHAQHYEPENPFQYIYNDVRGDFQSYQTASLAAVWSYGLTATDPLRLAPSETKIVWATPDPLDELNVWAVDAWTTPVANTDYVANSASDGSGTDVTSDITVGVDKFATAMKITLTNNHANLDAYFTTLQARGTAITKDAPARFREEDSTSQSTYGTRSITVNSQFQNSPEDVQYLLQWYLSFLKDPQIFVRATFSVNNQSIGNIDDVLDGSVDIGFRMAIFDDTRIGHYNVSVASAVNFALEHERHVVSPQQGHWATYRLGPHTSYGNYFKLNSGGSIGLGKLGTGVLA